MSPTYHLNKDVKYNVTQNMFMYEVEDDLFSSVYVDLDTFKNAPHLITMIGRFYEEVNK